MKNKELNQKFSRIQSTTEKLNNMIKDLLSEIGKEELNCSFCHPESICKKHKIEQQKIINELSEELE